MTTQPQRTRIVVIGGGAGGLELVRKLGAKFGKTRYSVILVDRNQTHIWKPLLHEVAAGSLDANLDEVGYRSHCNRWNYRFCYGSLEDIDRERRQIVIAPLLDDDGTVLIGSYRIPYDYLVIATGSVANDFGTPGAAENCIFLEDRAQADRFRNKLLNQFLRVSRRRNLDPGAEDTARVVIVGGGATGVELAAELFNAASTLRYNGIEAFDETRLVVTLVESGPRILPALPTDIADSAHAELEKMGVRVLTGTRVTEVTNEAIVTATGERLGADLRVWAAGVKGAPVLDSIGGLETTPSNQLVVQPTLQTTRDERIFAIGDCCFFKPEGAERPVPPRAQAAHQMASAAFDNIVRLLAGKPLRPFVYHDRGSLVSLSRYTTVGSLMGNLVKGRMAVEGRLARIVYISLYRMHLLAVHGWVKGVAMIAVGHVNAVVRPRLKLH